MSTTASIATEMPAPDGDAHNTATATTTTSSDNLAVFEVAPHLTQYNIPLKDLFVAKPGFTHFVSGAWIFSTNVVPRTIDIDKGESVRNDAAHEAPRVLLLQRAQSDSYPGFWEGPGGLVEPEHDATLLQGVAREVLEETGLRVTRFFDLVSVDEWMREQGGKVRTVAKFSFLVGVAAARPFSSATATATTGAGAREIWEEMITLDPTEHQEYRWVTEEEVQHAVESGNGEYRFMGRQGQNCLRAFQMFKALRQSSE